MTSEPWTRIVDQLFADDQADREKTTSPICTGCTGTGVVWVWTFRGKAAERDCWECAGTGLQPWARTWPTPRPLHCGRLDPHHGHKWAAPRDPGRSWAERTYTCHGAPLIEGGHYGSDAEDDAAEERAIRDHREGS